MQTAIDLAHQPDQTACTPMLTSGELTLPLRCCASCVWRGRGGDDCDDLYGGTRCTCFTPSADMLEQARALVGKLQMAYGLHLSGKLGKRLMWLEHAIDQLQQFIGNRRP